MNPDINEHLCQTLHNASRLYSAYDDSEKRGYVRAVIDLLEAMAMDRDVTPCEACGVNATRVDNEGINLCQMCWDALSDECNNTQMIRRAFLFTPDYITCQNCGYNFPNPAVDDCLNNKCGTWCQCLSVNVDRDNVPECINRAATCPYWMPAGLDGAKCTTPKEPPGKQ